MMDSEITTEIPQNLQMLVRLVVRGFYAVEDILIVDMLVRNLCMSEDDLCELLKFDRKMLRQRINTLKADKLVQGGVKTISQEDGKSLKEQYYFINYKSFVNVVKYKLDHIRKKLEMEERDQTSRASFKCEVCEKTYTDLEADYLLDLQTGELLCIICRSEIQEDTSNVPRHDTRIILSKFNDQMERLFSLLREVENIKLAAEFSEPKPQDFTDITKNDDDRRSNAANSDSKEWSGDASKSQGFQVVSSIDVNINAENEADDATLVKEKPIWLSDASAFIATNITTNDSPKDDIIIEEKSQDSYDVLKLLQQHEKKSNDSPNSNNLTSSSRKRKLSEKSDEDSDDEIERIDEARPTGVLLVQNGPIEEITISDGEDNEVDIISDENDEPMVSVGGRKHPISTIDNELIAQMTQDEKNCYITAYQEYCAMLDE